MGWEEAVTVADVLRPAVIGALRDRVPVWLNRECQSEVLDLVAEWERVQGSRGEALVLRELDPVFFAATYYGLPSGMGSGDRELCHSLGAVINALTHFASFRLPRRVLWPWLPNAMRALGPWLSPEDVLLVSLLLDGFTVDEARETVVACLT